MSKKKENDELNRIMNTLVELELELERYVITTDRFTALRRKFMSFLRETISIIEKGQIDYSRDFWQSYPDIARRINRIRLILINIRGVERQENTLETLRKMRENAINYNYYVMKEYMVEKGMAAIFIEEMMDYMQTRRKKGR